MGQFDATLLLHLLNYNQKQGPAKSGP